MPTAQVTGPSYVPSGYQVSQRVQGRDAAGLGLDSGQVGLIYRRGVALDDWRNPLLVYISPTQGLQLTATENHSGQAVDLGVTGVTAVYHDGMWMLGQGVDQIQAADATLFWDTSGLHSITAAWSGGTAAVRGPKGRGVGYDELIKVTSSLFSAGSSRT